MNIILSIDYEIFGDGSGDISACMIRPMDRMYEIASKYNALLSVFTEVMELQVLSSLKHHKASVDKVILQLQDMTANGHDVQLHLHPQWKDPDINGQSFSLKSEKWRMGNLSADEALQLINNGKQWLEALLQPIDKDYKCMAFRAGGWCIQPSGAVIKALQKNDILLDSTVAPGAFNSAKADWFDFRKAPKEPYWNIDSDVMQPVSAEANSIIELPITTSKINPFKHLSIIAKNMSGDSLAAGCTGSYSIPGVKESRLLSKFRKLSNIGNVMLDISTMPAETLIHITKSWQQQFPQEPNITAVAIGHTKNFSRQSAVEFEKYLQWAKAQGHQFTTYQQWLKTQTH